MGAAGRGRGGDVALRDDQHRAHAAVRGRAQRDLEAVGAGEPADHGQAEPRGLAEVVEVDAGLGLLQHPFGAGPALLAEAEAAVLDLDRDAGLHLDRGEVDVGLRRRVAGGVVEQFGQRVDEGFDGGADDGDLGDRVQFDPAEVEDPGDAAAQHAVQRDGPVPLAAGAGAAEHGDGVGEAADQRVAVVEDQQVVEDRGQVAVPVLHLPQVDGLAVDDRLHAAGDVHERALGGLAHRLLVVDGVEGGAQHGVPGLVEVLADLGDVALLVGAEHVGDELAALEPVHGLGQLVLGQVEHAGLLAGEASAQFLLLLDAGRAGLVQGPAAARRFEAGRRHGRGADQTAQQDSRDRLPGPGGGGEGHRRADHDRGQQADEYGCGQPVSWRRSGSKHQCPHTVKGMGTRGRAVRRGPGAKQHSRCTTAPTVRQHPFSPAKLPW